MSDLSYNVVSGDTLWSIARRNNMTLDQLLRLNPQFRDDPNLILPGQKVNLRPPRPPRPPRPWGPPRDTDDLTPGEDPGFTRPIDKDPPDISIGPTPPPWIGGPGLPQPPLPGELPVLPAPEPPWIGGPVPIHPEPTPLPTPPPRPEPPITGGLPPRPPWIGGFPHPPLEPYHPNPDMPHWRTQRDNWRDSIMPKRRPNVTIRGSF